MTRPRRAQIGLTILVVAFYLVVLSRNMNEGKRRSLLLSETPIAGDHVSIAIRVADVNLGTSELTTRVSLRLEGSLARDPVTPAVDLKLFLNDIWKPNGPGDDATGVNNYKAAYPWYINYWNISNRTDWNVTPTSTYGFSDCSCGSSMPSPTTFASEDEFTEIEIRPARPASAAHTV